MTGAHFTADLAAVADEALLRTNPVWSVDRLLERWEQRDASWSEIPRRLPRLVAGLARRQVFFPRSALARWAERYGIELSVDPGADLPAPGVAGLSIDVGCREAFVVPLVPQRSDEWGADPTLPFRPATVIQDFLLRLLDAHHLTRNLVVPERFAFSLRDPLGRRTDGPSMLVAAALAVVRELNGRPAALDRCCAVVQPQGDQLVPCGGVQPKLAAFVRECGAGTLLVRTPDSGDAGEYDAHFDMVWKVSTLEELARLLADQELLSPFLTTEPLSTREAVAAAGRAQQLEQIEHRYGQALDLLVRIEQTGFRPEVPNRLRKACRQAVTDLYRHLGAYRRAAELAEAAKREVDASQAACYDERAMADVTLAAALFAPHRFGDIRTLLAPWRESLLADPRRISAQSRVMVFNTLARALAAAGEPGWESLFADSEALLLEVDPADLPRTWSYRAHALLRSERLSEAAALLTRIEEHPGLGEVSRWFLRFLQAELARRTGATWSDEEMESVAPSPRVGHPFGFYLQATARQKGRRPDDAVSRFRAARRFFTQDRPVGDDCNIQTLLTDFVLLAEAAWDNNVELWHHARRGIEQHLHASDGHRLREYYCPFLPAAGSGPDRDSADRLLARVPFF